MASKRSYETYMDVATVYKHAIAHLESLHESLPKEWIEEPGNITSNEHHPKRRMTKRESSYDTSHLQADLAGFTATYDQQEASRDTRKVEQEAHEDMGVPFSLSWDKNKKNWITIYNKLQKNPSKYSNDPKEKRAGLWMMHIRASYKKGRLSQERIDELEAIPGWKWGTHREEVYTWEEHLQHWITEYEKRLQTPSSHSKDLEEKRAGVWQGTQRVAYKNGTLSQERIKELVASPGWEWGPQRVAYKQGPLSQEHIKELVASPEWEWGPQRAQRDTWEEQLQHWITEYVKQLQTPSETSKDPDEKRAGRWQSTQRTAYKKGTLSYDRIKQLVASPGWEWGTQREISYRWEEQRQHWITQYEKLQRNPSTISKDVEETRAGRWQDAQRTAYRRGTLSEERIRKLVESPGWEWGAQREITYRWEEQLQHWITQYEKRLQPPSTKSKDPEEKRAGQWQSTQRTAYNNGTLSEERIKKLVTSPGWEWGVEAYGWEEQRNHWVRVYIRIQKAPSQMSKDPEEKRAGIWQSTQRTAYKHGALSAERSAALEAIPGWTWSGR